MAPTTTKISFCLTGDELRVIDEARRRMAALGPLHNRSEMIRAAIAVLNAMSAEDLSKLMSDVPRLTPGRRPQV